jgi:hypothetical protein
VRSESVIDDDAMNVLCVKVRPFSSSWNLTGDSPSCIGACMDGGRQLSS